MPDHDESLRRFRKNPSEEPDKEFEQAFDIFVRKMELEEDIRNSKSTGSEKEHLQERYIDLLKEDIQWIERTLARTKPASKLGRRSYRDAIREAHRALNYEQRIKPNAQRKMIHSLIRERAMKKLGRADGDEHGLSDDAIARAIRD